MSIPFQNGAVSFSHNHQFLFSSVEDTDPDHMTCLGIEQHHVRSTSTDLSAAFPGTQMATSLSLYDFWGLSCARARHNSSVDECPGPGRECPRICGYSQRCSSILGLNRSVVLDHVSFRCGRVTTHVSESIPSAARMPLSTASTNTAFPRSVMWTPSWERQSATESAMMLACRSRWSPYH